MKIAVVGSRNVVVNNIKDYLPINVSEIVSGGAKGIDACAKEYAKINNIKYIEFLPEYNKFGKNAPLKRNLQIINYSDMVLAFWDGKSKGTEYVINETIKVGKQIRVVEIKD